MSLSALGFTSPVILAALLALPTLWFILRAVPQPPRSVPFSGLFFLKDLTDKKQKVSRIPWYILLIRLLAAAAIIIGLAGPVLHKAEQVQNQDPVLIVLDDSWLAGYQWNKRQNILKKIAAENDGNIFWIYTTSPSSSMQLEDRLNGPLDRKALEDLIPALEPVSFLPNRKRNIDQIKEFLKREDDKFQVKWLTDDFFTGADIDQRNFARALESVGDVAVYTDDIRPLYLPNVTYRADELVATVKRPESLKGEQNAALSVLARDGRVLSQVPFALMEEDTQTDIVVDLPLALRNDIGQIRIAGQSSAGAVHLVDASARRSLIGIVGSGQNASDTLLDGQYYIRQALAPYSLFTSGSIEELVASDTTVIILDDVGRLRETDQALLFDWVRDGGVLIRFSGPSLADASQSELAQKENPLLPVTLRAGGRAFGGALTWEDPQRLGGFSEASPFSGMDIDETIRVRRQVLARPDTRTAENTWAFLEDGTPLVTAQSNEKGLVVLFHVTATPDWSDLPISGLFVDMLREVTTLSVNRSMQIDEDISFTPLRVLDGRGRLQAPLDDARPVTIADRKEGPDWQSPPGLYGSADTPFAINTVNDGMKFYPLEATGVYDRFSRASYSLDPPRQLGAMFLLTALVLFFVDTLISVLFLGNGLFARRAVTTSAAVVLGIVLVNTDQAAAQTTYRLDIDEKAIAAALETRFAYVVTGDDDVDYISERGLDGLRRYLIQRTALEPAEPVGIDLEIDDLSVYPIIYFPITPDLSRPSDAALANLESFMASGGLVIIDTLDGDRQIGNADTAESIILRNILERMNIPPLEPLPAGHVLGRSFYLLDDLPGRNESGPIWVKASTASGSLNDNVTPLIIGGRDWASAWAIDQAGRPIRPVGAGGLQQRSMAVRAGINMAMVALTGNYKLDQLHAEALLNSLGNE